MSILNVITNKTCGYEDAFGTADCSSIYMKDAIEEWFRLFYQDKPDKFGDPCQRIPYTVVNKLTKTMFGEYQATGQDDFASSVLDGLDKVRKRLAHDFMIGGISYIKPFPLPDRFVFSSVSRANMLIFGTDAVSYTHLTTRCSTITRRQTRRKLCAMCARRSGGSRKRGSSAR